MSPVFSEGSGAGGGREKAAPEWRVVCLKRGAKGENLSKVIFFSGPAVGRGSVQGSAGSLMGMTTGLWFTPTAMKASGTALGPGRAHGRRAGAPTGRMTALPTKKQAEEKFFRR